MDKNSLNDKPIKITGAVGFTGANLVIKLLDFNVPVNIIDIDNLNFYYDVSIKNYQECFISSFDLL